jgi:hypothetical protein
MPLVGSLTLALVILASGEDCPASADVEARVRAILHLKPQQVLAETFVVERHEAELYVELRGADSTLIGERSLPADGTCDELTQAAAVVLSAWLSDVHPDFADELPTPTPKPAAPPESPSMLPPPPPPPPPPPRVARQVPPRPSPPARRLDGFLGIGANRVGSGFALQGSLGAGLLTQSNGLGLSALGSIETTRSEPLGNARVVWSRYPLGAGPTLRLVTRSLAWDLTLAPALVWVRVEGDGFDRDHTRNGVTVAGLGQLRAGTRGRRWGVWGALTSQVYFGELRAFVGDSRTSLPRAVIGAELGVRFSP